MRGWLVVVVALSAGCNNHEQAKKMRGGSTGGAGGGSSEAEFAAQLAAALPGRTLSFDADKHQLSGSDELISTTNLYQEWLRTPPAERPDAVKRIAAGFLQTGADKPKALADVRAKLRPVVRAVSYFDPQQLAKLATGSGAKDTTVPYVLVGNGAAAAVAIDAQDAMSIATNKDLADWNVTIDQALLIATANLRGDGAHLEQLEPGVWTAQTHDSYDASRLMLVPDIKALPLSGSPVALIPNRETLLIAGSKDAKGLMAMAARAQAVSSDPRPIHTQALCLADGIWKDCIPDATPAVHRTYESLAEHAWIDLYGDNHDLYQEQLGDDLFVAHLSGVEKDGGEVTTYATWTKTVPTMLPKADWIAFVVLEGEPGSEKGKMLGLARWERVMAALGSHLKETGHMPRYWATGEYFPTAAELTALALVQKP